MNYNDIISNVKVYGLEDSIKASKYPMATDISTLDSEITKRTKTLARCKCGEGHDHFLVGIIVQFDLTFTIKAWVESDRYHWFEFVSSQSTMHRISKFDFKEQCIHYVDPRIISVLEELKGEYNILVEQSKTDPSKVPLAKEAYLALLYSTPTGFKLTAKKTTSYLQLKTIYFQRRNHRLPEWIALCNWIETLPKFKELILDGVEVEA